MTLSTYLGGRLVLGSGRTWPHDFLFLVFFSPDSGPPGVGGMSTEESGVMMSCEPSTDPQVSKREVYISSGQDMKDSAGEASNLTVGVEGSRLPTSE